MINGRFLLRELVHSRKQAVIYILCVALSLVSLVTVNSFRRDIDRLVTGDAKALHGGDIIIHSHHELSQDIQYSVADLTAKSRVTAVRTWRFYSVARRTDGSASLLCNIKAVDNGYPLYGRVDLHSGRAFSEVLKTGEIVVEKGVLDRLGAAVGDQLQIGKALFLIADVILYESARPVSFYNIGPRILVSSEDLSRMDLVQQGSRVRYETLLKLSKGSATSLESVAAHLREKSGAGQVRIETFREAGSGIKRFFDNLLFYLSLIAVFTLLLAGIGIESSLSAILHQKEKNFAIIRSLGATQGYLLRHYMSFVLILSGIGCILGIVSGLLLKGYVSLLFTEFLPPGIILKPTLLDLLEGLFVGLLVVSLFTFLPLWRITHVKPASIFRNESSMEKKTVIYYLGIVFGLSGLIILLVRYLNDARAGFYFFIGILLLTGVIALMTRLSFFFLSQFEWKNFYLRLVLRSLLRPGNVTQSIVVTLAVPLSLLMTIYLVENNLRGTFIDSFPPDAPTLFSLDIQKDQKDKFQELVGGKVQLYPVIRARLISVNGRKIDRGKERQKRRDNLAREFNLSYRDNLLDDEILVAGGGLFRKIEQGQTLVQVSVLDTVAEMGDMELGDILDFNIQGVPMKAVISSIRSRTRSMLYPFFYFIFPEKELKNAPQTYFAALYVDGEEITGLENDIVKAFPNISTINIGDIAKEMGKVMEKLTKIIIFFAAFSILAGGLIIVSSILATRLERIKEAVSYKILGADSRFVLRIFFLENLLLALLSSAFALILAQAAGWGICHFFLEIQYAAAWGAGFALIGLTVLLVTGLGLLGSISIIQKKPAQYLRQQS